MRRSKRPKYKVRIYDEAHLVDRGSFSLTWLRVIIFSLIVMVFFISIGVCIVWFTPVKNHLPGYLRQEQRDKTEEAFVKVDSLLQLYNMHQAYLDNLVKVLDTDREPDVADTIVRALPLIPDSIMVSSEIEREFIRKMEEAGYVIAITEEYEGDEPAE